MTLQTMRVVIGVCCLTIWACAQSAGYFIEDSGAPASRDGDVAWFDDHRVLFYQLKIGKNNKNLLEPFIWDTANNSVSPYPVLQGSRKVRVCGEFVSYIRRKRGIENEWLLVYGKIRDGQFVEDQVADFPNPSTINPFSCRYYPHPYPWTVKGRRTMPLLEAHGFLDFGPDDLFSKVKRSWTLYRPGIPEGLPLPLPGGVGGPMGYEPFRHAYLFVRSNYRDPITGKVDNSTRWPEGKPIPIWWLTPDGKVTEEAIPYHPMARSSNRVFLPVKGGVFVYAQDIGLGTSIGYSGGYLARAGTLNKLIAGLLHKPVVSPDGCRVAFVHESEFPTSPENGKIKILDLCEGGTNE